jgi:hypothetical protein
VRRVLVSAGLVAMAVLLYAGWSVAHARQRPRISPRGTVHAQVDSSTIDMEYGRPSKRGRVIWGGLVPWDHWWMPGADESTTITTDRPLVFAGTLLVPAGAYSIYTLPAADDFKLIIVNETGLFHTRYPTNRDLGRVSMTMKAIDPLVEQMTFAVEPREGGGGLFKLIWDDREYSVPFVVKKGAALPRP